MLGLRLSWEARIGLFLGLMSAHTDRLFVVISLPCEKISERFYIGAKVSAHEPIFQSVATTHETCGTTHESGRAPAAHCAFMSCAFPFHPPMKVANLTFIS